MINLSALAGHFAGKLRIRTPIFEQAELISQLNHDFVASLDTLGSVRDATGDAVVWVLHVPYRSIRNQCALCNAMRDSHAGIKNEYKITCFRVSEADCCRVLRREGHCSCNLRGVLSTIAGLRRLARARGISQMQHGFETRHRRGVSVLHSPVMKTETAVEAMAAGDVKTMAFKEMTDAQTALLDGKCAPLRYISPWPCMSA